MLSDTYKDNRSLLVANTHILTLTQTVALWDYSLPIGLIHFCPN